MHSKAGENGAAVSVLRLHTLLTPCPVLPERVFDDCLPYAAGMGDASLSLLRSEAVSSGPLPSVDLIEPSFSLRTSPLQEKGFRRGHPAFP